MGLQRTYSFNGLRKRRVPGIFVTWIEDFCSHRQAAILINGETTDLISLDYAGLPQGSPILLLFFNAGLVQGPINKNKGYTRALYNGKSKTHPGLLCQLRTGICRLNNYLCKIRAAENGVDVTMGKRRYITSFFVAHCGMAVGPR